MLAAEVALGSASHALSDDDLEFRRRLETCELPPDEFDHRSHVRMAYGYLIGHDTDEACRAMAETLARFIAANGVDPSKYHETITRAWILAVRHFVELTPTAASADDFIAQNPKLLDSNIMLTHYSAELLFSDEARSRFIEPDLDPIPRYGEPD